MTKDPDEKDGKSQAKPDKKAEKPKIKPSIEDKNLNEIPTPKSSFPYGTLLAATAMIVIVYFLTKDQQIMNRYIRPAVESVTEHADYNNKNGDDLKEISGLEGLSEKNDASQELANKSKSIQKKEHASLKRVESEKDTGFQDNASRDEDEEYKEDGNVLKQDEKYQKRDKDDEAHIAYLERKISNLSREKRKLEKKNKDLAKKLKKSEKNLKYAEIKSAASMLHGNISEGLHFEDSLNKIKEIKRLPSDIKKNLNIILQLPTRQVMKSDALSSRLSEMIVEYSSQKNYDEDNPPSFWQKTLDNISGHVVIRKVGADHEGDDDGSVLARSEALLQEGKSKEAIEQMGNLSKNASDFFADWITMANEQQAALDASLAIVKSTSGEM